MSTLIKPKDITLKSDLDGIEKNFRIGRYPATVSVEMLTRASSILKDALKGSPSSSQEFAKETQKFCIDICKYVEVETPGGGYALLNMEQLINAHIPDGELLLKLAREVHDYNSFFTNTGRLLQTSRSMMGQAVGQITQILNQCLGSLSANAKQHSSNSGKSTTTKTRSTSTKRQSSPK